jgi:MarR family transcriptional regulator, lower aerobic nicotinate degradation pathway regulator
MDPRKRDQGLDQPRKKERPYRVEEQIGFLLRVAFQYHTSIFMSRMVANLTQTQFAALSRIHGSGECSQADLAAAIEFDSATINGVVWRMRARGLITIAVDPADRRRQFLSLTPEGEKVIEEAERVGREVTERTLEFLTPTEQTRLIQLLHKMMSVSSPVRRQRNAARLRKSAVKSDKRRNPLM